MELNNQTNKQTNKNRNMFVSTYMLLFCVILHNTLILKDTNGLHFYVMFKFLVWFNIRDIVAGISEHSNIWVDQILL